MQVKNMQHEPNYPFTPIYCPISMHLPILIIGTLYILIFGRPMEHSSITFVLSKFYWLVSWVILSNELSNYFVEFNKKQISTWNCIIINCRLLLGEFTSFKYYSIRLSFHLFILLISLVSECHFFSLTF